MGNVNRPWYNQRVAASAQLVDEGQLARWRSEFPALATLVHGRRLVYLDHAATALKPRAVLEAITRVATEQAGNVHRGVHAMAEAATSAFDAVRPQVAAFLGGRADEIVFTSGATAAINLVAHTFGLRLGPGDAVLVSEADHHANLVPWQLLCEARGCELRHLSFTREGELELGELEQKLDGSVRLVALAHLSNVLGTVAPIRRICEAAHVVGARVLVDGAQAVAHLSPAELDVTTLGCDFYVFSGHKLFAPPGTGVLWARRELLESMPPWQAGGEMIASVDLTHSTFRPPPERFEAGTPNIWGVIGLGAALEHLASIPHATRAAHEAAVHHALLDGLRQLPGVHLLGAPRLALASFTVDRAHPHDVATLLDERGVAIRAGHHCAEPLHRRLGLAASCRASLAYTSGLDDVHALLDALHHVREVFP